MSADRIKQAKWLDAELIRIKREMLGQEQPRTAAEIARSVEHLAAALEQHEQGAFWAILEALKSRGFSVAEANMLELVLLPRMPRHRGGQGKLKGDPDDWRGLYAIAKANNPDWPDEKIFESFARTAGIEAETMGDIIKRRRRYRD